MKEGRHSRVVVTGGIGSGKSVATGILADKGIPVIHADKIGHAVLEPEGEAYHAVSAWWPEVLVDTRIDRHRLAAIVFNDRRALAELESMTHPAIAARILNLVEAEARADLVVVELPLLLPLLGEGWTRVVVDAPLDIRRQRLATRGMEAADIDARLAAQPSDEEWREAAEFVIDNGGALEELESEVERLLKWLHVDVTPP